MKSNFITWVGGKQREATQIISHFPLHYKTYIEPFLGGGAILTSLAPTNAIASDIMKPLIEIWENVKTNPESVKREYRKRYNANDKLGIKENYLAIRESFNNNQNGHDLLYLSRSCYGGNIRFNRAGMMNTSPGIKYPLQPDKLDIRVDERSSAIKHTRFFCQDYTDTMAMAKEGDFIYCDPPYVHNDKCLYGAQDFSLAKLYTAIADCKQRGVKIALSIDGKKHSGNKLCDIDLPSGLFVKELFIDRGVSNLNRLLKNEKAIQEYKIADRLLLTY